MDIGIDAKKGLRRLETFATDSQGQRQDKARQDKTGASMEMLAATPAFQV